jgi:hypothetical protein
LGLPGTVGTEEEIGGEGLNGASRVDAGAPTDGDGSGEGSAGAFPTGAGNTGAGAGAGRWLTLSRDEREVKTNTATPSSATNAIKPATPHDMPDRRSPAAPF